MVNLILWIFHLMKKRVAFEREHRNNSVLTVSKKFNILSFSFYYMKNGLTSSPKYCIYII